MVSKLDPFFEEKLKSPDLRDDMKYEFLRLKSFNQRSNTEKGFAIRLASAGFYFIGPGNKVRCFVCLREKDDWTEQDEPCEVHRNLNSHCGFLTKEDCTNVPINSDVVELPEVFNPITHLFKQHRPEIPTEVVGSSMQVSSSKKLETSGLVINPAHCPTFRMLSGISSRNESITSNLPQNPSDPLKNIADDMSHDNNRMARTTSEDVEFNERQMETFSLSLKPGSSGPSSRENLANMAVRSSSGASSRPELVPQQLQKVDAGTLKYERHRLETYGTWPMDTPVTAKVLANNGFYYTQTGDRVQCVFCKGVLKDWEVGDKPHIEHKNRFPRCPFILGTNVGNVPIPPPNPSTNMPPLNVGYMNYQPMSNMEAMGINTERPKFPQYAVESSRISTFRNWPTYKHQTPEALGSAGFFYAGFGDNVKCFYCDGGLRNWEVGDDPWVEHARWFPRCPFVMSVKGQKFINNVQDAFKQAGQKLSNKAIAGGHVVEDREIKDRMELPLVRTVLSTGVCNASVMKVREKRLRETGDDFADAEALLEAVLTMESQPEEIVVSTPTQGPSSSGIGACTSVPSNPNGPSSFKSDPGAGNRSSSGTEMGWSSANLNQQNDMITCKICLENEVRIVFLPCGHLCYCVPCAPAVQQCISSVQSVEHPLGETSGLTLHVQSSS